MRVRVEAAAKAAGITVSGGVITYPDGQDSLAQALVGMRRIKEKDAKVAMHGLMLADVLVRHTANGDTSGLLPWDMGGAAASLLRERADGRGRNRLGGRMKRADLSALGAEKATAKVEAENETITSLYLSVINRQPLAMGLKERRARDKEGVEHASSVTGFKGDRVRDVVKIYRASIFPKRPTRALR